MNKVLQLMTILVIMLALAAPGYGKPNNNGNNNGKPGKEQKQGKGKNKDKGTTATFALGDIVVDDDRILDLTGDYTLTGAITEPASGTGTVDLSLTQDSRGRLNGTADIILPEDAVTSQVELIGSLKLSGRDGNLSFRLEGTADDDDTTGELTGEVEVVIIGTWNGTAFDTEVMVTSGSDTFEFDGGLLVPANTLRGFTITGTTETLTRGKGKVTFSEQTVLLPWGTEDVRVKQISAKGFKLIIQGTSFKAQLRGSVDSAGTATLSRVQVNLGYGRLLIDPESVELPAVQ